MTEDETPVVDEHTLALDLEDDTPLENACDLSGEGGCEACQ